MVGNRVLSLSLVVVCMLAVGVLRWAYATPTEFIEGDDAAIAAGVARICVREDIGPYYFHPPRFLEFEYRAYLQEIKGADELRTLERFSHPVFPPFYRYHTMTGVYFLGKLTCALGAAGARMLMLCFIAGTFTPVLLALFLFKLFRPLPLIALLLIYLMIAISPELFVSGSVYINDKILAVFCLSSAFLFAIYGREGDRFSHFFLIAFSGVFYGLAILMRFDSVLFLPGLLLLIILPLQRMNSDQNKPQLFKIGLLLLSAGLTYILVMRDMSASISLALSAGSPAQFSRLYPHKFPVILAGFGWGQLLVLGGMILVGLIYFLRRLRLTARKRKLQQGNLKEPRLIGPNTYRRLDIIVIILFLILPEMVFYFSIPYGSPKYFLLSSSVIAGLCAAVPLKFYFASEGNASRSSSRRRLVQTAVGIAILLPLSAGLIKLREIRTEDGLRHIGGWMVNQIPPHPDSIKGKELISCISEKPNLDKDNIVVKTDSWMMEESIAFEAAIRGWENRVVPLSAAALDTNGEPIHYYSLNEYSNPARPSIRIYTTSNYDVLRYGKIFTDSVFEKAIGTGFQYFEDINCLTQ